MRNHPSIATLAALVLLCIPMVAFATMVQRHPASSSAKAGFWPHQRATCSQRADWLTAGAKAGFDGKPASSVRAAFLAAYPNDRKGAQLMSKAMDMSPKHYRAMASNPKAAAKLGREMAQHYKAVNFYTMYRAGWHYAARYGKGIVQRTKHSPKQLIHALYNQALAQCRRNKKYTTW